MPGSARQASTMRSIRSATMGAFLVVVVRPERREVPGAVTETGEVLQSEAVGGERVALEVEVEIAGAGFGEAEEPLGRGRLEQCAGGRLGGTAAELLAGLFLQPLAGGP